MANTVATSTAATALDTVLEPKLAQASDGTLFLLYYDGTAMVYRSAPSPYTTWSAATTLPLSGSNRYGGAIHYNASDNSLDVVYHQNGGGIYYVKLSYSSGTTTWSNGSAVLITLTAGTGSTGEVAWIGKDQAGTLWVVSNQTSTTWEAYYSTDGGATWTASVTGATEGGGSPMQPAAALVGKYLLVCYSHNNGQLAWRRLDTTGTLTAWSTEQLVNLGVNPDFYPGDLMSLAVDGAGRAIFVMSGQTFNFASGVWAKVYTPTSDTWGADTHLGTLVGGANPDFNGVAASNGSDIWVLYTHGSATAGQSTLVMKKWTSSSATWDTSATTLEATVANYQNPTAVATSSTLYFAYTTGSASPYTVAQDSVATSSLATLTRTVATTAALLATLTRSVAASGALLGTFTHGVNTTAALGGTLTHTLTPTTAALRATATRGVAGSVTLESTLTRALGVASAFSATTTHGLPTSASLSGGATTRTVSLTGAIGVVVLATIPLTIEMPGIVLYSEMGGDV